MSRGKKGFFTGVALLGLSAMFLCVNPVAAALTVSSDAAGGGDEIPPGSVAVVEVEVNEEGGSIIVSWPLSADDFLRQTPVGTDFTSGGTFVTINDVVGYDIFRADGESEELIGELPAGETSLVDAAAMPGVDYIYTVVVVDAAGNEAATASEEVTIPLPVKPSRIIKMTLKVSAAEEEKILGNPAVKEKFVADFSTAMGDALNIAPSRIRVLNVKSGSLIIEFEVIEDEDDPEAPTVDEVAAALDVLIEEEPETLIAALKEGTDLEEIEEIVAVEVVEVVGDPIDLGEVLEDGVASDEISLPVNEEEAQTVTITVEGDGFGVSETELVVEAGEVAVVEVSFDAAVAGNELGDYVGSLLIKTDAPATEITHALTAAIIPPPPAIDLSSRAINFPAVQTGESKTILLTIGNIGGGDLEGTLALDGDAAFTISATEISLAAGEELEVEVVFLPLEETSYSGTILVSSNDPEDPELSIALSGVGREGVGVVGDFDGDEDVDFDDFFLFADQFGTTPASPIWDPLYSLDGDEDVDFDDFFIFADNFGTTAAE